MPDSAPVGELIDAYFRIREERNAINNKAKELNDKLARLEGAIIESLDHSRIDQGRGNFATGSISETVVPTIKDFSKVQNFIYRHKALHLMEARISSRVYREMLEERGEVPGLEPFTRRKLNVQKRSR